MNQVLDGAPITFQATRMAVTAPRLCRFASRAHSTRQTPIIFVRICLSSSTVQYSSFKCQSMET